MGTWARARVRVRVRLRLMVRVGLGLGLGPGHRGGVGGVVGRDDISRPEHACEIQGRYKGDAREI